jgi:hypothetical protein
MSQQRVPEVILEPAMQEMAVIIVEDAKNITISGTGEKITYMLMYPRKVILLQTTANIAENSYVCGEIVKSNSVTKIGGKVTVLVRCYKVMSHCIQHRKFPFC